jgi:hypothetical protein
MKQSAMELIASLQYLHILWLMKLAFYLALINLPELRVNQVCELMLPVIRKYNTPQLKGNTYESVRNLHRNASASLIDL